MKILQIDRDNANLFVEKYGDIVRFHPTKQKWYIWDGVHWQDDTLPGQINTLSDDIIGSLCEAIQPEDKDERPKSFAAAVRRAESSGHLSHEKAMMVKVSGMPEMRRWEWDKDPWLLGVENGILDLRTGELLENGKETYVTIVAGTKFDPEADCPVWKRSIGEWFAGMPEVEAYAQRCIGYSLTGDTTEQAFWCLFGEGGNGKNKFYEAIAAMMGKYAYLMQFSTLEKNANNREPYELAQLEGVRFVVASETDESKVLDAARVKSLTGDQYVNARPIYGENRPIKPEGKIFLAFNEQPDILDKTDGIWRRMHMIPFPHNFTKVPGKNNLKLGMQLLQELPGILNWALEGLREWEKVGLAMPEALVGMVEDYRRESDSLTAFFETCCEFGPGMEVDREDLYRAYTTWHGLSHQGSLKARAMGAKKFNKNVRHRDVSERKLGERGFQKWSWMGLRLKPPSGEPGRELAVVIH